MRYVFVLVAILLLVSCGSNLDFSGVEIVDVKVGPDSKFAVAYYSNETVNVYSFNKLVNSFQRRAVFVRTSDKVYGGYFLVKDFGFMNDGKLYIVAYKPTLGWLVKIGDKEVGYYSYVSLFKFSDNSKLIGYVYNVGGEFSNNSVIGGKYYVNVNGLDMGPYDYVGDLIFSKNEDTFAFSYSNDKKWYVKISDYEYICYNEVILPSAFNVPEDMRFMYRIRRDWFLHPTVPIQRNIYKIITSDNHTFFVFTNANFSLVSNNFTNFSIEGSIVDLKSDGEDILLVVQQSNKQKILFKNRIITFDTIHKYQLLDKKVIFKAKNNEGYYIGIDEKLFGPYEFADFYVEGKQVKIGYIKDKKLHLLSENF